MKIKKIAAAMLAAAMLAVSTAAGALPDPFSVTANAADEEFLVEGDYKYTVNSDGESVTIIRYEGTDTNLVIPPTLAGKKVTILEQFSFGQRDYKSVTIPEGVKRICEDAFFSCRSLEEINLPDSLEEICNDAFEQCVALTRIRIPKNLKKYEGSYDCTSLVAYTIDEDNPYLSVVDGVLFNKDRTAIYSFPAGKKVDSYVIPSTVTTIGTGAFKHCSINRLTIPISVVSVRIWAFSYVNGADIQPCVVNDVFYEGSKSQWEKIKIVETGNGNLMLLNANIHFAKEDEEESESDWSYKVNSDGKTVTITGYTGKDTEIIIPAALGGKKVTDIGREVFKDGIDIVSITIPDSVTTIGRYAFDNCASLTSITLPSRVTKIDVGAFNCCSSLKSITIPDGVTTISGHTFSHCERLTSITIPESVKTISTGNFAYCANLKDVFFGGSKSQWKEISIDNSGGRNDNLLNATIHFAKEDSDTSTTPTTRPTSSSTTTSEETTSELPAPDIPKPDKGDFREENEVKGTVEPSPDAAGVPADDRITSITINPAFNMKNKNGNDVELDLSKITVKASEIYDEEGLKRAEEALGETLKGNKKYNLLDLTLLYNGEDFSNGYEGLVKVIIPIPKGHRDKTFSCYRLVEVNGKMVKQLIPGEQTADSYIIYLEHFSVYALVADGDTPRGSNPTTGVAMAAVPVAMIAAVAVVIAKKRK